MQTSAYGNGNVFVEDYGTDCENVYLGEEEEELFSEALKADSLTDPEQFDKKVMSTQTTSVEKVKAVVQMNFSQTIPTHQLFPTEKLNDIFTELDSLKTKLDMKTQVKFNQGMQQLLFDTAGFNECLGFTNKWVERRSHSFKDEHRQFFHQIKTHDEKQGEEFTGVYTRFRTLYTERLKIINEVYYKHMLEHKILFEMVYGNTSAWMNSYTGRAYRYGLRHRLEECSKALVKNEKLLKEVNIESSIGENQQDPGISKHQDPGISKDIDSILKRTIEISHALVILKEEVTCYNLALGTKKDEIGFLILGRLSCNKQEKQLNDIQVQSTVLEIDINNGINTLNLHNGSNSSIPPRLRHKEAEKTEISVRWKKIKSYEQQVIKLLHERKVNFSFFDEGNIKLEEHAKPLIFSKIYNTTFEFLQDMVKLREDVVLSSQWNSLKSVEKLRLSNTEERQKHTAIAEKLEKFKQQILNPHFDALKIKTEIYEENAAFTKESISSLDEKLENFSKEINKRKGWANSKSSTWWPNWS